jgi:hypothetical protein
LENNPFEKIQFWWGAVSINGFGLRRVLNCLVGNKLSTLLANKGQSGFRRNHLGVDFSVDWDLRCLNAIGQWSLLLYDVWTDQSIDPPNDADAID